MARFDLFNPTKATRIFHDGLANQREIRLAPGEELFGVDLSELAAHNLMRATDDLEIKPHDPNRARGEVPRRPALVLDGRFGIGDAIHQRGVIRELMADHEVWLQTCHYRVYEDLVARGLKLIFKPCRLHAQAKTIERERELFPHGPSPPSDAPRFNLSYNKHEIDKYGSILEAMAGCVGVKARPLDFSLPVRREWVEALKAKFNPDTGGKPILVYRPIVLRPEWNGANRNPDSNAYSAIFRAIRDGFFVVSVADLAPDVEWIVGPEEDADVKLHKGELAFEELAALYRTASLAFCNAGFAPVLAQAVGTPSITVYGGRESYRTTQRAGEHLAPTLGIDADNPCDCHAERHQCPPKTITLEPAIARAKAFAAEAQARKRGVGVGDEVALADRPPRPQGERASILIFATTYVDSGDREQLTRQWLDLHTALNDDCDFLIVDSHSPKPVLDAEWADRFKRDPQRYRFFDFGDNVGHLSRGGRDGWGRAFCKGLDYAVEHGYQYALHIEGDSLLRVPARDLVEQLKATNKGVASIPVRGTAREFPNWVETGLMLWKTAFLKEIGFTANYDWPHREVRPTPELVVHHMIAGMLLMLDLKGLRGDKNQIAAKDIPKLDLDWVTHCHSDIWVYREFVNANMPRAANFGTNRGPDRERRVAMVAGGAANVWREVGLTLALAEAAGAKVSVFAVNDMIPLWPGPCAAVSLHPNKLKDWLARRAKTGRPAPDSVWCHVKHEDATDFTEDWRGSSGLFAVKVALKVGFDKVILAGVPMSPADGHFVRGADPWRAGQQFLPGWKSHLDLFKAQTRSWSGWTAEQLGKPDLAFLGVEETAAA